MQSKAEEFAKAFHCTLGKICNRLNFRTEITEVCNTHSTLCNCNQEAISSYTKVFARIIFRFLSFSHILCVFFKQGQRWSTHYSTVTFRTWGKSKGLLRMLLLWRPSKISICVWAIYIEIFTWVYINTPRIVTKPSQESERNKQCMLPWKAHTCDATAAQWREPMWVTEFCVTHKAHTWT